MGGEIGLAAGPGGAMVGAAIGAAVGGVIGSRAGVELNNVANKAIWRLGLWGGAVDTSSSLAGAAFALPGVCRLALTDQGPQAGLAALPGIGVVVIGVGLIFLVARPSLSRLGRSRWDRYRTGNISRQRAGS